MYWYIYFMVLILVCLQMVSSQVSVSYTYVEEICPEKITLKCTYIGGTSCCSASTRLWFKNDVPILSDGVSTPVGKYSEIDLKPSDKQFSLVINNFGKGDMNAEYKCSYALTTSTAYNLNDDPRYTEECKPWYGCGGICSGFSCLGSFVDLVIFIVVYLRVERLRNRWTLPAVILMIVIPSIVLTFVISFTFCTINVLTCDDEYQLAALWILLGLGVTMIYAVAFCFYFIKPNDVKSCRWIICIIVTLGIALIVQCLCMQKDDKDDEDPEKNDDKDDEDPEKNGRR